MHCGWIQKSALTKRHLEMEKWILRADLHTETWRTWQNSSWNFVCNGDVFAFWNTEMQRSAQRHEEKYVNALLKHTQFCPHSAEYRCTHSLLWDRWGHPPSSSSHCRPPPPASLTGVKEPIVIQSALPPTIVCDSWKPSELIQTSAHWTVPPPSATALSFLFFNFTLSFASTPPLTAPFSLCADWALQCVAHTDTAGPVQTHTGRKGIKKNYTRSSASHSFPNRCTFLTDAAFIQSDH